jgi:uncharacterized membrane protein YfcA
MYTKIKKEADEKEAFALGRTPLNNSEGFKITSQEGSQQINQIMIICFIGGIISGMLGVGGGIVMAPLMLELGVEPKVTTSTSNFLLIFTSSAGTFLYFLSVIIIILKYFLGATHT